VDQERETVVFEGQGARDDIHRSYISYIRGPLSRHILPELREKQFIPRSGNEDHHGSLHLEIVAGHQINRVHPGYPGALTDKSHDLDVACSARPCLGCCPDKLEDQSRRIADDAIRTRRHRR
jgi:hypothetical protein